MKKLFCFILSVTYLNFPAFTQDSYTLPKLPYPAWKLSATILDDWLYLYGGNKGGFRDLSSDDQMGDVWRVNINGEGIWEKVVSGIKRESLSMLAYDGALYILGGLTIWNKKGERPNQQSTNQVWRYDPTANIWSELTSLPESRSGHGATIVNGKIYVLGGQNVQGSPRGGASMHKTAYVADLSTLQLQWKKISDPPFS